MTSNLYIIRCVEYRLMMDLRDCYHARAIQDFRAPLKAPLNFSDVLIFFSIQTQHPWPQVDHCLAELVYLDPVRRKNSSGDTHIKLTSGESFHSSDTIGKRRSPTGLIARFMA